MDKDTSNMDTEIKTESESPHKFTSVLERRRIKRKEEDEANIEWSPLEKPDNSAIESRMDNIIENLKKQFKQEKFARRQAPKVSTSYKVFCNSVDAFLRHLENPKVKYQESNRELPGNAVKPDKITSTKQMSVDTPAQDSPVHDESLDDDDANAAVDDGDDVQQVKHKECEHLISQMLNNVILRDSKTINCSEVSSLSMPHFFGEPTVKKLVTQTKADDIKPMPSLFQKRHTSNAYFFSLKQKKLINGCLLPYLLAPSPFIGLNRKQKYMEFYEVKFKPAEVSLLMSNPKYKVGDHISKCEHLPVNKCIATTQKSDMPNGFIKYQQVQTENKNKSITQDIGKSKVPDFKRIFSLALRYNKVPCPRTLSIFGLYFTPILYFGREAEMPRLPHSLANFTDERKSKSHYHIRTLLTLTATTSVKYEFLTMEMDIITTSSYLNTKHPAVTDLDSYKLKPVKHIDSFENVFFDNVAITSSHLNTEYPAVKDLDSDKLKPAKHDDTSGKVFFDNFETMEKNDSKQVEVQPEELEVIIDDDDDDSPFGILSVYCRSGIHSR
ncbi:uncharacterized protein LOC132721656 [Ruditapes philippinarum]|uniref:uncharacterized protein LOC132721656 n=1 Tax=Ruditapes philippinarum TaxID=129788 RepID=UPI00295B454D|nr:uncharacterized protein LOC132721656 [Ruditapes philippinarum]